MRYIRSFFSVSLVTISSFVLALSSFSTMAEETSAASAAEQTQLEKLNIAGAGLVMVHPTQGIGTYDAVRFTNVSLRYREGQKPLSKKREAEIREQIISELAKSTGESGAEVAEEAGACVVDVELAVVNIDFRDHVKSSGGFQKNLGSATMAYDMRDSVSREQLVFMAGRRDFGSGRDRGTSREDFKRLSENIGILMVEMGQTLGNVVRDEIISRGDSLKTKEGCQSLLRAASDAAAAEAEGGAE